VESVITVALLYIAYQITVNIRNRHEIINLRDQVMDLQDKVLEANQQYEMILLYGKTRETKEEAFQEEERLENQRERTGQAPNEAIDGRPGI